MFLFHACEFHYHTDFNSVFTVRQVMKVSRDYSASGSSSLNMHHRMLRMTWSHSLDDSRLLLQYSSNIVPKLELQCLQQQRAQCLPSGPVHFCRALSSKGLPAYLPFQLKFVFLWSLPFIISFHLPFSWKTFLSTTFSVFEDRYWFLPSILFFGLSPVWHGCVPLPIWLNVSPLNASYYWGYIPPEVWCLKSDSLLGVVIFHQ